MSRIKTHVKKGDNVTVIAGAHKGAQGVILEVQPAKARVAEDKRRFYRMHHPFPFPVSMHLCRD